MKPGLFSWSSEFGLPNLTRLAESCFHLPVPPRLHLATPLCLPLLWLLMFYFGVESIPLSVI